MSVDTNRVRKPQVSGTDRYTCPLGSRGFNLKSLNVIVVLTDAGCDVNDTKFLTEHAS